MKKEIYKILLGAMCLSAAVIAPMFFAGAIFKAMLRDKGLIKTMIDQFSLVNIDAAFICVMILVLWVVDLFVRPIIKDLIQNALSLWRGEEDGTTTTATAKDA
ncbi:hypothetical protein [Lysinibacillus irui]|uniref:hypothetical protein n=1 Tax=Lysinibacillus irui TaxID=2998077 RepID=UPI002AD50895|nr:hypothetical protein [Lysinibacillus irui]MEA0565516.1 hypothetical protein [Lysinibacillus irui]